MPGIQSIQWSLTKPAIRRFPFAEKKKRTPDRRGSNAGNHEQVKHWYYQPKVNNLNILNDLLNETLVFLAVKVS